VGRRSPTKATLGFGPCIKWLSLGSKLVVDRYLETFSRHKIAVLLPVIIALFMSTWYATSAPHKYETSMTVWFDTAEPNPSSLAVPQNQSPAAEGQLVLEEFLGTGQFLENVGHRGPLATFLATYHPAKKGPSAFLSKLKSLVRKGSSNSGPVSSATINSEIESTLGKAFAVSVVGPQVVRIAMTAPDPSYMPGTLNAVAAEYVAEVTSSLKSRAAASVAFDQTQVSAANSALKVATSAVSSYQRAHPGALPTTDVNFSQLTQVAFQDQTNATNLETTLQQASLAYANVQGTASFHVIDPALAAFKLSSKKHMIFTIVAGLIAGLVISLLALSALMSQDKTARRPEDIDGTLGLEVVSTIGHLPRQRKVLGLPKAKSS